MGISARADLLERIDSFDYWHYPFELGGGVAIRPEHAAEKLRLRDFIWPAVLGLCGGSLDGMRVLDVGCNAGFWSLEAHRSGATYVLGVDPRPVHLQQAELVRDALDIDPGQLEYRPLSVYELSREEVGEYDLCLLLRVLQHVRHPLLALDKLRGVCGAYLVVDVKVVDLEWPVLYLHAEDPGGALEGIDSIAAKPSQAAVELMLTAAGFSDVKVVPAKPPPDDYSWGKRAVFTARVVDDSVAPR
jgi:tRNA (mo5U34)-methyltransferase